MAVLYKWDFELKALYLKWTPLKRKLFRLRSELSPEPSKNTKTTSKSLKATISMK